MTTMQSPRARIKSAIHATPGKTGQQLSDFTGVGKGSVASYLGRMIRDGEIKGEADEHGVMRYTATRNGVSANPQPEETKMEEPAEYAEYEPPEPFIKVKKRATVIQVSLAATIGSIIAVAEKNGIVPREKFIIEHNGKKIRCRMPK